MLGKLRVAYYIGMDGTCVYGFCARMKLAIDGNRVAQFVTDLSRTGEISLPPIDEVFAAWIWCAGSQWAHASVRRDPFVPHADIEPVIAALVELGYAKAHDDSVLWTDKIAPAMRIGGLWDENNFSREEADEREIELDMRDAFASIPEDVRHMALRGDIDGVLKALKGRWADGAWLVASDPEVPWYKVGCPRRARRLIELVEGAGAASVIDVN
jgi:hypothetical protein